MTTLFNATNTNIKPSLTENAKFGFRLLGMAIGYAVVLTATSVVARAVVNALDDK